MLPRDAKAYSMQQLPWCWDRAAQKRPLPAAAASENIVESPMEFLFLKNIRHAQSANPCSSVAKQKSSLASFQSGRSN